MRSATDLASICARRSSFRACILRIQHTYDRFSAHLMQSLPNFAYAVVAAGFGSHATNRRSDQGPQSLLAAALSSRVNFEHGIQFNAWKPPPALELRVTAVGVKVPSRASPRSRHVVRGNSASSNTSRPHTAASASSVSLHGFIASDDGGSSAYSDSSDAEVDARSAVEGRRQGRRLSGSVHFSDSSPVQRRPQTSSAPGSDSRKEVQSIRRFHDQTSSARALSTSALLRALSESQQHAYPLQVVIQILLFYFTICIQYSASA